MIARTDSVLLAVYPVFYFLIVFLFLCYFTLADKSPLVSLCLVRALCLSASSPPISELSKRAVKLQGACMHKKICCCTLIFHIQHPLSFCYLRWREVRWNNGSFPRISEERPVFSFLILIMRWTREARFLDTKHHRGNIVNAPKGCPNQREMAVRNKKQDLLSDSFMRLCKLHERLERMQETGKLMRAIFPR